jgi:hypothetical protein
MALTVKPERYGVDQERAEAVTDADKDEQLPDKPDEEGIFKDRPELKKSKVKVEASDIASGKPVSPEQVSHFMTSATTSDVIDALNKRAAISRNDRPNPVKKPVDTKEVTPSAATVTAPPTEPTKLPAAEAGKPPSSQAERKAQNFYDTRRAQIKSAQAGALPADQRPNTFMKFAPSEGTEKEVK